MGYRTYQSKISGRTVTFKVKKADAESYLYRIADVVKIGLHRIRYSGVIGVSEHTSRFYLPLGPSATPRDPEVWQEKVDAFLDNLPNLITYENWPGIRCQISDIMDAHTPIEDKRITPEKSAEDHRISEENAAERAEKTREFLAEWSDGETHDVPDGMRAIVIGLYYDDSDPMTDYFAPHRKYQVEMILGFVPENGSKTEIRARSVMERYPELRNLDWSWHTENWSMGHGNYLRSKPIGRIEGVTTYGGYSDPACWLEVGFGWNESLYGFRGFPGPDQAIEETVEGEEYEVEYERDWTWVKFPQKPTENIINNLRASDASFGKKRVAWYFRRHVEADEIRSIIYG